MIFLLISCFSFLVFLFKSFTFHPLPPMESEWRLLLLLPWFWKQLSSLLVLRFFSKSSTKLAFSFHQFPVKMPVKKMNLGPKDQEVAEEAKVSLLDLPELALDSILERLSPSGLVSMSGVCSFFNEKCKSDHLWEKHLRHKWGKVIGDVAYKEWKWHISKKTRQSFLVQSNQKCAFESFGSLWPFSWIKPKFDCRNKTPTTTSLPVDSTMGLYLALESGRFWFPAQVYNRENGHVGFMLSCYDAQLSYDSRTDTFQARYWPQARRSQEENIHWDRIRAPPVDTPAYVLYTSDCLNELMPGDHVEVQWRKSKEFPFGWWYAVISHLESCDGNVSRCQCKYSDMVVLEFNQYSPGSRWRRTGINRNDHSEEGDEADGFYGGIRKLSKEEEISMWKKLWPNKVFD